LADINLECQFLSFAEYR